MHLPPYDTTAPLHRQQETTRTATHSKLRKRDIKQRKNSSCCRNQYFFFIFITRGEHLPRGGGNPANPPLFIIYSPAGSPPAGYFFVCWIPRPPIPVRPGTKAVNAGRGFRILKMQREKTRRKVSIKNTAKKFLFF